MANPGDKAAQLRMLAQLLNRIVCALQFLLAERRMDRGMTDPVQRDSFPAIAAARHKMMLVDAAASDELAPAQRAIAEIGHCDEYQERLRDPTYPDNREF